ncbi:alpha/beta hydrolase [Nonomuraea sp. CA-143628]|uniref:alpha/beta hydrolase n=1 Tax=Nonomuraea sp. CA-143628 TaxID=3239997 RepID=UPI003D91DD7A
MKRVVRVVVGMAMLVPVVGGASSAVAAGRVVSSGLDWGACPVASSSSKTETDAADSGTVVNRSAPRVSGVECASVRVPLDYNEPAGQSITLALNRIKAKVPRDGGDYLGPLLVNPGGPGASGRSLAEYVSATLSQKAADRYDIIGFDPRGVGNSEPAMHCVDPAVYYAPPRPDAVPRDEEDEKVLLGRASEYASRCGDLYAWLLPHLTTENTARDMDSIRAALGESQISFLGYSYGTYIGAIYATLFPDRVKHLVLDSTVDPDGVWYKANLAQDRAFERRHRAFLAWTAKNNAVYKLGGSLTQTSFAWYAMRSRLHDRPAAGVVGPSELDDTFTVAGYSDRIWPDLAAAWSRYVRQGDGKALVDVYNKYGKPDADEENGYAIYLSVQCRDAQWPTSWDKWRTDMTRVYRQAPFLTWSNAWYNAPCAFWSVPGGTPVKINASKRLPPILMIQSKDDAATPYQGALNMRKLFPSARMVVDAGGNHGSSLSGNQCVDRHLVAYLVEGTVPRHTANCDKLPAPKPTAHMAALRPLGHERRTELLAR